LIGRDEFSDMQLSVLRNLLEELIIKFKNAKVVGHNELDPRKTCPNFDVKEWWDA
jgi:N-acetyl-anhydromuramyl-L-alanine amidase AmpD